jgi:(heptosyl)LPS beta-1,4-glucosyltransferase
VTIVELVRNELAESARGAWILVLDPDERITEGLARELRRAAARPDLDAVVIPRMNYDLGYAPSHSIHRYEPQLRMYRRSAVSWPTIPNALPKVPPERVLRLPGRDDLVITHYRSRNIPEILDRWVRYAPAQAQSMIDRGQVFTASGMIRTMWWSFHRQFVRGRGLRDGVPGLIRGAILMGFHFMVWSCFWQLSGAQRTPRDDRMLRRLSLLVESMGRFGNLLFAPADIVRRIRNPSGRRPPARDAESQLPVTPRRTADP